MKPRSKEFVYLLKYRFYIREKKREHSSFTALVLIYAQVTCTTKKYRLRTTYSLLSFHSRPTSRHNSRRDRDTSSVGPRRRPVVGPARPPTPDRYTWLAGQRRHLGQPHTPTASEHISAVPRLARSRPLQSIPRRDVLLHLLGRRNLAQEDSETVQVVQNQPDGALARRRFEFHVRRVFPGRC